MDDGSYQTLTQATTGNFRVGDRVRIENGALYR
jgi:outer membrane lipoprotein SlyB